MASPASESPKIRFGPFELDEPAGRLLKAGTPLKLAPQPMRVLSLLIRKKGHVVTREEIQKSLWGDTTFVDYQHGINFSINQIRAALCDDAEKPRYIETLPRIGYRFIGAVNEERESPGVADNAVSISTLPPVKDKAARKQFESLGVILLLLIVGLGYLARGYLSRANGPSLQQLRITKLTDSGTAEEMAISPDGRYVVYSQTDGEKESLPTEPSGHSS